MEGEIEMVWDKGLGDRGNQEGKKGKRGGT